MKANIKQIEYLLEKMKEAAKEHPKATIYYDWEDHELRIAYPLPRDYNNIKEFKAVDN